MADPRFFQSPLSKTALCVHGDVYGLVSSLHTTLCLAWQTAYLTCLAGCHSTALHAFGHTGHHEMRNMCWSITLA